MIGQVAANETLTHFNEVALLETNENDKIRLKKVWSNAWPEEEASKSKIKADVHKLISENIGLIDLKHMYFR
jgi:hypothetical protein